MRSNNYKGDDRINRVAYITMQLLTINTNTTEIIYRKISDVSTKAVAKTS